MLLTSAPRVKRRDWLILIVAFIIIIILTIYKDWALTGNQPNILFYILVPVISMSGSVLAGYGLIRFRRLPISFWDTLFIILVSDFIGQVYENLTKLVYYWVWSYPGWLYIAGFLPLIFTVPGFILVRWYKVNLMWALLLSLAFFIGGVVLAIGFTTLTGLDTPGS